jgi:hypothetical protein
MFWPEVRHLQLMLSLRVEPVLAEQQVPRRVLGGVGAVCLTPPVELDLVRAKLGTRGAEEE